MECSICYEAINQATGKAELSCSHSFHLKCLSFWFTKNESCPCCRHAANDTEKMNHETPVDEDDEDDEDEDDEDSTSDEDSSENEDLEKAAMRERARHHFIIKRANLTKADYQAYAATRIAALVRGHQSRTFFFELKCWKDDEKNALESMKLIEKDLEQARASQVFYKKVSSMTSTQRKKFAATLIQSAWRAKKQKKAYEVQRISRALMSSMTVVSVLNKEGAWKTFVTA